MGLEERRATVEVKKLKAQAEARSSELQAEAEVKRARATELQAEAEVLRERRLLLQASQSGSSSSFAKDEETVSSCNPPAQESAALPVAIPLPSPPEQQQLPVPPLATATPPLQHHYYWTLTVTLDGTPSPYFDRYIRKHYELVNAAANQNEYTVRTKKRSSREQAKTRMISGLQAAGKRLAACNVSLEVIHETLPPTPGVNVAG